jgi:hypothetical protein
MAMLRWEPFREMENVLRRFSPLYLPDHGVARVLRIHLPKAKTKKSEPLAIEVH